MTVFPFFESLAILTKLFYSICTEEFQTPKNWFKKNKNQTKTPNYLPTSTIPLETNQCILILQYYLKNSQIFIKKCNISSMNDTNSELKLVYPNKQQEIKSSTVHYTF